MTTSRLQRKSEQPQEQNTRILEALLRLPENKVCAECERKYPRWASHSLGIFVCLRCSGIHRSLGTHISRMKSVDLDAWTAEQVQNMAEWGNARANWFWGARMNLEVNDRNIDFVIRCKYERRQFARSEKTPDPRTIPVGTTVSYNGESNQMITPVSPKPKDSSSSSFSPFTTDLPISNESFANFGQTTCNQINLKPNPFADIMSLYGENKEQQQKVITSVSPKVDNFLAQKTATTKTTTAGFTNTVNNNDFLSSNPWAVKEPSSTTENFTQISPEKQKNTNQQKFTNSSAREFNW